MRRSLLLALLPVALLAACNRSNEADKLAPVADTVPATTVGAPAPVEAPVAPATAAEPVGVSDAAAPGEHTNFDAKAFAGAFGDANSAVTFAADGTYSMTTESVAAKPPSTGTWTLEPDSRHVRLDPNDKAEQDRVYELVSNDELHATDGQVLRRAAK
jgi:copper homeostasis protein (lipoprotein)